MPSQLAFRAQLVIRNQRRLYDYWRAAAGSSRMPRRSQIDPVALPDLLPGLAVIDARNGPQEVRYRVAGTQLRDIYGAELTNRRVFDLDLGDKRDYWATAYAKVVTEKTPMQGALKGPIAQREHIVLFWLRLPLSDDGEAVDTILGYDIAMPVSVAMEAQSNAS
ncbi:MAG: PAS domain-containing protein [Hyphomicrobiales bacterium]|nr:PAS domain-containing protein [Hyphomicrobiales bacterium]